MAEVLSPEQKTEATENGLIIVSKTWRSEAMESFENVAEFLAKRVSDGWNITVPTDTDVRGVVEGERLDQKLRITSPTDFYPQYQGFLPLSDGAANWTLPHGPYHEGTVFDRNLAWVHVSPDQPSAVTFGVVPEHGLSEEALLGEMTTLTAKVNEFVGAVLLDQTVLPYTER